MPPLRLAVLHKRYELQRHGGADTNSFLWYTHHTFDFRTPACCLKAPGGSDMPGCLDKWKQEKAS